MPIVNLYPTKDAILRELSPPSNYGTGENLQVSKDSNGLLSESIISFDLSSLPAKSYIKSAKIHVFAYSVIGSPYVNVLAANSDWLEESVTWSNKPNYGIDAGINERLVQNSWASFAVTQLARNWKDGVTSNFGVFLKNNNANTPGAGGTLYSSEYSTDPTKQPYLEIEYSETPTIPVIVTPNGGETWTGNKTVEITPSTDPESDPVKYEYQLSVNNGQNWSTIQSLTSDTSFIYDFSNEQQTSLALIRSRAYDGFSYSDWDVSDGVFTIQHNLPPTPPTNLHPSGKAIDRSIVQRLSWTYNDPDSNDTQSKAVVEWRLQGSATWNVITINSNRNYFDVSSNVFPVGQVEWRVKTYDQTGTESPFSQIEVFTSAEPTDEPTITSPSSTVNVSSPVVQWTVPEQTAYQVVVEDTIGTVIWDTGEVVSTNKARTIGASLVNGGQYVIKVRVKNNTSLWTEYTLLNITVSYTPPPKPTINVTSATGHIVIEIDNPSPSGTQPTVTGNDVYKQINGEWVRIAEGVNFVPYRDYAVASGVEYNYKVRAIGDNGTFSESNVDFTLTTFRGVWLHTINNAEVTVYNFKFDGGGRESSWEVESSLMRFKGRTRPVIETGEMKDDLIDFNLTLKDNADKEALERIVKSQEIVCYRDGRGRMRFGVFTKFPLSDEIWGGYSTQLQLLYIDYSEVV